MAMREGTALSKRIGSYKPMRVSLSFHLEILTSPHCSTVARGFTRAGQGNPDEARAARFILKDYVNGKVLFCHPPPGVSEDDFNKENHERRLERYSTKKKAPVTRVGKNADTYVMPQQGPNADQPNPLGQRSMIVDEQFFLAQRLSDKPFVSNSKEGNKIFSRSAFYPNQVLVSNDGTPLAGPQVRMQALMRNMELGGMGGDKKHKKPRRAKQRSGRGYDD